MVLKAGVIDLVTLLTNLGNWLTFEAGLGLTTLVDSSGQISIV